MAKTKTKKAMVNWTFKAADGGERLPPPLWRLLKDLDDDTLARIEHIRKEKKLDWTGVVLFLLKKVHRPIKSANPSKHKG